MQRFYSTLSEKGRRVYAAVEALKLGYGGSSYITRVLGCDHKTIKRGTHDLQEPPPLASGRVRQAGGGRKKVHVLNPEGLDRAFLVIVGEQTAGDPMRGQVRWTNLGRWQIALRLLERGYTVSRNIVRQPLKRHGYRQRKAQKSLAMGRHPEQNGQFENIARLKQVYQQAGNPILSMDTKKKENLGNFCRAGSVYAPAVVKVLDHDFSSAGSRVAIPHGLYDLQRNEGYLTLGNRHDTSEFACGNLYRWWVQHGTQQYPDATSILLLCDGGGSNSANPHVTRACQGVVFDSLQTVEKLMAKTQTRKGLKVTVEVVDKLCQTGRKYAEGFKANIPILFDCHLPKWDYTAVPSPAMA